MPSDAGVGGCEDLSLSFMMPPPAVEGVGVAAGVPGPGVEGTLEVFSLSFILVRRGTSQGERMWKATTK